MLCNVDLIRPWLKQETGLNHIRVFIYLFIHACMHPGFSSHTCLLEGVGLILEKWVMHERHLMWSLRWFFYFLVFKYIVAFWLGCSLVIYNCFNWLSLLWNTRKNPQRHWSMYSVHFSCVIVSLLKSFFESFESIVKYIHIQGTNSWSNNLL